MQVKSEIQIGNGVAEGTTHAVKKGMRFLIRNTRMHMIEAKGI